VPVTVNVALAVVDCSVDGADELSVTWKHRASVPTVAASGPRAVLMIAVEVFVVNAEL
jgi:hypothetical protein